MSQNQALYALALRLTPNIGDANFRKLLNVFHSAENIWKEKHSVLARIEGIGPKTVQSIGNEEILRAAEQELEYCDKNNIKILTRGSGSYPSLLHNCEDAPAVVFVKGKIPDTTAISIVGTRKMTAYGKNFITECCETWQTPQYIR